MVVTLMMQRCRGAGVVLRVRFMSTTVGGTKAAAAAATAGSAGSDGGEVLMAVDEFSFTRSGRLYEGRVNVPFFNGVPADHIRFAVDPAYHLETAIQEYVSSTGNDRSDVERRLDDGEDPHVIFHDYCRDPVLDALVDAASTDDPRGDSKDEARRALLALKRTMLAFGAQPEMLDARARLLLYGQFGDDGEEPGILALRGLQEFPDMQRAFDNSELFDIIRAPSLFPEVPRKMDALAYFCGLYNPTTHMIRETNGRMYEISGTNFAERCLPPYRTPH